MIKRIISLLKRIRQREIKKNVEIEINNTSFLLDGSNVEFRVSKQKRKYVIIGEKCIIKAHFIFETPEGTVSIGNNVHIGGAQIICKSAVIIEDDVTMAWGIVIYDHDSHSTDWELRKSDNKQCYEDYVRYKNNIQNKEWTNIKTKAIHVKSKVWIGFDVLILKGVTIGEGAVIAAKSVVTKDVPPWTLVAGNPARVVKYVNKNE